MALDNSSGKLLADAILLALHPETGTTTVGSKTITAPNRLKLCTNATTPSATVLGTEISAGGSYVQLAGNAGGVSIASNWGAPASGSMTTDGVVSQTNMPAVTVSWVEIWDSSGTNVRIDWPSSFTAKTCSAGDTLSFAAGQITCGLT